MGSILATAFLALFLAIGVGITGYGLYAIQASRAAADWPSADGKLLESRFLTDSDSDGETYRVKVRYTYSVNGVSFEGDRIVFGYTGSSARKFHEQLRDALPQGAALAVRYDPHDPARATLSYGVSRTAIAVLVFGLTWTIFTLGFGSLMILMDGGADVVIQRLTIYGVGR